MTLEERTAPTDADLLVAIAEEEAQLTRWQSRAYATVATEKGRRTFSVRGSEFQTWLRLRFRKHQERIAPGGAVRAAITALEDIASLGTEQPVFLRTAAHEGRIYLDMADDSGRAIEVDASGWRTIPFPAVRFIRSDLTQALPKPAREGSIELLRGLVNVPDDGSFQLLVTWCVAGLMPSGPYPILAIGGEHGSSKSTLADLVHDLIDPSLLKLRSLPRSERELYITTSNAHLLAFDNISTIPDWLSDAFCKVSTGGGMALRKLFTDESEVYFRAIKPIILNGIEDVVKRPDLADRAIIFSLPAIPDRNRLDAAEFAARFDASRPAILGALLDLMAVALARLPSLKTDRLPRMTGFARLGIAIEDFFGPPGCFMRAYDANRAISSAILAENDPLIAAVTKLVSDSTSWQGTASELAKLLEPRLVPPKRLASAALGGHLRRIAPVLRTNGVNIEFDREGKGRTRTISISSKRTEA